MMKTTTIVTTLNPNLEVLRIRDFSETISQLVGKLAEYEPSEYQDQERRPKMSPDLYVEAKTFSSMTVVVQ